MNNDDYESLPTTSFGINMTAGAAAGILEHCIMYPMDSVKTRMQSLSPATASFNISTTLRNMIKLEGLSRPIRGISAVVAGAGPAHALHFGCYEKTKELLTNVTANSNINYMISGIIATVIHDAVSNPTDVIKQRMQMYNSPYKSVIECMRDVYRREGVAAFYRSYSTQLVMNVPYNAIHFSTYEFFQNMLNKERRYSPVVHVMAGGASGACAAAFTTPLDVIKTTLNTQETGFTNGMTAAIKRIYTLAGPLGFFKGLTARVVYSMPATAICWSTYEFFKFYLAGMDREHYKSSIIGRSQLKPRQTDTTAVPYVLPSTTTTTTTPTTTTTKEEKDDKKNNNLNLSKNNSNNNNISSSSGGVQKEPTNQPNTTHALPPVTSTKGSSIKSVCDLGASGAAATPTLNLNTRHTEVKMPFDRRFSS